MTEPGWYHDDFGAVRWWNGAAWDAGAPGPPPVSVADAPPPPAAPVGAYGGGSSTYPAAPLGYDSTAPGYAAGYGPGYGYASTGPNTTMAWLPHLGAFVGGIVLPLVIYLTAGKDDPFVRHHSAEALNFQLTYIIVVFGGMFVGMALAVATAGIGFFVIIPLFIVAVVLHMVWAIMGAMRAYRGEWWRYPVNIRMVKGAV